MEITTTSDSIGMDACEWKALPKNMNNRLHTMCSYIAMFPPSVPHYFIHKYSDEGDVVLDPFSGRGTTVLEACLLKRKGIGNDMNPLAFLLTKAKTNVPQQGRVLSRIKKLEQQFNPNHINITEEHPNIHMIFSNYTLKQLVYLRNSLNWRQSPVDRFIAAMIVGIMHGSSEGYLSLSMPNTFSMSPNYIKGYIKKHKLHRPNRNVFDVLRRKLNLCYQKCSQKGKAYQQDVRKMSRVRTRSVNLIITSPPYTRVIRYGQFNWIRLWFLRLEGKQVDKKIFFTESLPKYLTFMSDALREMKRVIKPDGTVVLVIGDVKNRTNDKILNLAEEVYTHCAQPLGFSLAEPIYEDIISDTAKVSRIWGAKKGNATKIDRILVLTLS